MMSAVLLVSPIFSASASLYAKDKKIKASAGPGGVIDPEGDVKVKQYTSITFTITPDKDYEIEDVVVDGESVGPVSSYTFYFVRKDHTIKASFKPRIYNITASAGEGGEITPSGEVLLDRGDDQSFDIVANRGYDIEDVLVDGESVGAVSTYRFTNVTQNHTIAASFTLRTYTITANAGEGGEISPSGEVTVDWGSELSFDINANDGYDIEDVLVDEESQGAIATYTFTDVSSDHTISASFVRDLEVLDVSIPNDSMKIGDEVQVTITVTDDGGSPYTLVSGTVGGYPLLGFERISATSYLAGFTIIEGGNSYEALLDIPVSDLVISDGEMSSETYELLIVQNSDPIDAQAPVVIQVEVPSVAVGVGGSVILTITTDGDNYSLSTGTMVNGIPLNSSRLILMGLGNGLYELSFVVEAGDANVDAGLLEAIERGWHCRSAYSRPTPHSRKLAGRDRGQQLHHRQIIGPPQPAIHCRLRAAEP